MENDNNSIEETLTHDTEAELDLDLSVEDENEIDLVAENAKLKKAYEDQKRRAEIAESKKTAKPVTQTNSTLTVKDGFALAKANVNDEDIEDILEYANFKKISVADALKSTVVKSLLAEKEEFRTSQNASTSSTTRRATPKITDDTILENARNGKLGDSEDEIRALFRARTAKK